MSQLAADPWDRDVEFEPSPYPYDPRDFLRGVIDYEGRRLRGFFDAGSWSEYLRDDWQSCDFHFQCRSIFLMLFG